MRDGYAVRAADLAQLPATLEVIGEIKAGARARRPSREIAAGTSGRHHDGRAGARGADAVVMVEYTSLQGDRVDDHTRHRQRRQYCSCRLGSASKATLLLQPGTRMDYAAIALAASVGQESLCGLSAARRWPFFPPATRSSTSARSPAQPDSQLQQLFAGGADSGAGGEPNALRIAPDEPAHLRELIEQGLKSDLLLLTGGVSMGKYDLVEQVLAELARSSSSRERRFSRGGRFGIRPRPREREYFFGLPGNPVSTMVTFELFARPMLEALAGMTPRQLVFLHARLKSEITLKTGLSAFCPRSLSGEFEQRRSRIGALAGSGDIAATARANCYVVIPPDRERHSAQANGWRC